MCSYDSYERDTIATNHNNCKAMSFVIIFKNLQPSFNYTKSNNQQNKALLAQVQQSKSDRVLHMPYDIF